MSEKIRWRVYDTNDGTYLTAADGWDHPRERAYLFSSKEQAKKKAGYFNDSWMGASAVVKRVRFFKRKTPDFGKAALAGLHRGATGRINDAEQRAHDAEAMTIALKQTIRRILAGRLTDAEHQRITAMVADVADPSPWCPECVGLDGKACSKHGTREPSSGPRLTRSAMDCEHANENPRVCPCDADCYCRDHTCSDKPLRAEKHGARPAKGAIYCGHANEGPSERPCGCPNDCACRTDGNCGPKQRPY